MKIFKTIARVPLLGFRKARDMLINGNTTVANIATGSTKALDAAEATHKTVVTTTGGMGAAKGTVDMIEDLACQDYVCFTVDTIGVCADVITCCTSFLPGLNVTSVVTIPISMSCKTFRWCCKRAGLPFGCGR